MTREKIFLTTIVAIVSALPVSAAQGEFTFSSLAEGPNLALAIIALVQLVAIISVGGIIKKLTTNSDYFIKLKQLKERTSSLKTLLVFVALSGWSMLLNAQGEATESAKAEPPVFPEFFMDVNSILLLVLNLILLGAFIYMVSVLRNTVAMLMPELSKSTEAENEAVLEPNKVMQALTDAIPLSREHEIMMDHEYDGIRELDNNLPPWWVWMFYATIAFGAVYLVYYHVLPYGMSQEEQYLSEMEDAEESKLAYLAAAKNLVDENNVAYLEDASDLTAGKAIFIEKCQQCHAPDGGGGVGPNLTDPYWIHGGSVKDIFKTVKYGVPTKGMIAWESQLRPIQMAQVTSFIKSLQGTTPAAPKDPQGELWVSPEADTQANDSTEVILEKSTTDKLSNDQAQTAAL